MTNQKSHLLEIASYQLLVGAAGSRATQNSSGEKNEKEFTVDTLIVECFDVEGGLKFSKSPQIQSEAALPSWNLSPRAR